MKEPEMKPSFINMTSLGGIYMGVALSAGVVFSYLFESAAGWINNLSIFVAFIGVAYYMGKRYVAEHREELVGFGKSLGFVVVMMSFAGILYGVTTFIMYNYIAPEYYQEQTASIINKLGDDLPAETIDIYSAYFNSPILMIFSAVFTMIIYGIFPALIIAALVKTKR